MTLDSKVPLDRTDWRILAELQRDARLSFAEIGRRVSLTQPAVAERVRRLEQRGVIQGYRAQVDLAQLGLPILAFINITYPGSNYREHTKRLNDCPEILECHHVTGTDCFIAKVCARSMSHLEEVVANIARIGSTTTTVVYSSTITGRIITDTLALDDNADQGEV